MKKMVVGSGMAAMMDAETSEINVLESSREGISRIYRVKEDCKMQAKIGDYTKEADVKAGDIVIVFYEREFPNTVAIVKSEEWNENFDAYEKIMQKRKEEWAVSNLDANISDAQSCKPA